MGGKQQGNTVAYADVISIFTSMCNSLAVTYLHTRIYILIYAIPVGQRGPCRQRGNTLTILEYIHSFIEAYVRGIIKKFDFCSLR